MDTVHKLAAGFAVAIAATLTLNVVMSTPTSNVRRVDETFTSCTAYMKSYCYRKETRVETRVYTEMDGPVFDYETYDVVGSKITKVSK